MLFFVICASAKRDFSQSVIFGAMDTPNIHIHVTVDELLQHWPQVFSVFMKHKTKCPGCFMQQFCTLEDVAETYQIPSEELLAEIENVTH
jgi:hybrid cluster-associated redox disulfide protein